MPTDPAARAAFEEANDPLEPLNRTTFEFNRILDGLLIKNIALLYRTVLPDPVRTGIRHVLHNLNQPIVFANNMLQGELQRAGTTAARFSINTTLGLAGIFDVATGWGFPEQTGDFGQTLWSWGVPEGPYLVLPLLGPSDPRDAIGEGVDGYIDPFRYVARREHIKEMNEARFVTDGVDQRAQAIPELEEIEKTSVDFYAELRSLWRQHRAQELSGTHSDFLAAPPLVPAIENELYQDPAKASPPAVKSP
ncbi:MAG TPA: VacJ family lipoprotein [Stellaceae bacterium]|nr:VacJ family lipoprotein [Stellaceae bacterium]